MLTKLLTLGIYITKDISLRNLMQKLEIYENNFIILPKRDKYKIKKSKLDENLEEQSSLFFIDTVKKSRIIFDREFHIIKKPEIRKNEPKIQNINTEKGSIIKSDERIKIVIPSKYLEWEKLNIEKEINRVIDKIKNADNKKLKIDEVSEGEGKLNEIFGSDKLKELLKEKIIIKKDSNINKLLESSEFLSHRIFSEISKLNLVHEIPFKNLEINILLDC